MQVLLLTDESDESELGKSLKEGLLDLIGRSKVEARHFGIRSGDIRNCLGCFSCWIKTNGKCIIGDVGKQISDCYTENEFAIVLSPVKFGCYSTVIKHVLDRITPNNLPFLIRYRNRTRHKARYDQYPQLVVVGYGGDTSEAEAQTFAALAKANAVNFQKESAKVYLCRGKDEIINITGQVLKLMGMEEVTV